jgi:hypothetical protein
MQEGQSSEDIKPMTDQVKFWRRDIRPDNVDYLTKFMNQLTMLNQGFIVHGDNEVGWVIHSNLTLCEICENRTVEIQHVTGAT